MSIVLQTLHKPNVGHRDAEAFEVGSSQADVSLTFIFAYTSYLPDRIRADLVHAGADVEGGRGEKFEDFAKASFVETSGSCAPTIALENASKRTAAAWEETAVKLIKVIEVESKNYNFCLGCLLSFDLLPMASVQRLLIKRDRQIDRWGLNSIRSAGLLWEAAAARDETAAMKRKSKGETCYFCLGCIVQIEQSMAMRKFFI